MEVKLEDGELCDWQRNHALSLAPQHIVLSAASFGVVDVEVRHPPSRASFGLRLAWKCPQRRGGLRDHSKPTTRCDTPAILALMYF